MVKINNQRLVKWCRRLENDKDSEYYKLFISNTRIRKPRRDYIFDCSIELVDELNNRLYKARILYMLIKSNKEYFKEYLKFVPFTKDIILNTLYRKYKFPMSFRTYKKILLVCDLTEHFANDLQVSRLKSILSLDTNASLLIGNNKFFFANFKMNNRPIYKMLRKNCLNHICLANRYLKYLGFYMKLQRKAKNTFISLPEPMQDIVVKRYREKFGFGSKVSRAFIIKFLNHKPTTKYSRFVKVRFLYAISFILKENK
jgi:hypothetical protein